jgi:hypothetical protein
MTDNDLPTTSIEIVHTLFPAGGRDVLKRKPVCTTAAQKIKNNTTTIRHSEN